jgi:hypothetical protein
LPVAWRSWLVTRAALGWHRREPDPERARELVESIRLLSETRLRQLFPGGTVHREKFLGVTKSLLVHGGWQ